MPATSIDSGLRRNNKRSPPKKRDNERNCIFVSLLYKLESIFSLITQECTKTIPKVLVGRRTDKLHKITENRETDRDTSHDQSL